MTRISIFLSISLLIVNSNTLAGQNREKILSFPNAAELGSFGRTPVGLFTGTNQVSIPVAELKSRHLSYPVSLNYSSNGLKVDKISSRVGFDWTISIEGVIIRVIKSQPDDISAFGEYPVNLDPAYFYNRTDLERQAEYSFYNSWSAYLDTEPDMYSFNFCGYSGQFYYDFKNNGKYVLVPYKNMVVTYLGTGFQITDDKGIKYSFIEGEKLQFAPSGAGITTSTYYLTKVLHPSGDSIMLNYDTTTGDQSYIASVTDDVSRAIYGGTSPNCSTSPTVFDPGTNSPVGNLNRLLGIYKLVNSIEAPGYGKIVFKYQYDRQDFQYEPRLDNISVYNSNNELLRSVKLYQHSPTTSLFNNEASYYPRASSADNVHFRMFLDSVVFRDNLGGRDQKYLFEYNNLSELPVRLSYAQDHWGYFNGANNQSLMPDAIPGNIKQTYFPSVPASRMSANRSANYLYSQKGLLSKVVSPTGGFTTYEYEPHRSYNHPSEEHGGVRLKAQRSYTSTGQLSFMNEYAYSGGNAGWDHQPIQYYLGRNMNKYTICSPQGSPPYEAKVTFSTFILYSAPLYSLAISDGNYIAYQYVTTFNGSSTTNSGKEDDEFVTGYDDFEALLLYFDNQEGSLLFPRPYSNSGWKSGTKLRETIYKNTSGSYVPVKEEIYTYTDDTNNSVTNYYVSIQNDDFMWPSGWSVSSPGGISNHFNVDRYSIISGWRYMSSKIKKSYDNTGVLMMVDTTRYYYDNPVHAQLTREERRDSRGNLRKKITRFPNDYTTTSYNLGTLRTKLLLSLPVDTRQYVGSKLVGGEQLKYGATGLISDVYIAEPVTNDIAFSATNPYTFTHKATYTYDTYANLRQIDHDYNFSTTYLWSFGNTLPVAKVENATYSQVSTSLGTSFINTLGTTTSSSSVATQLTSLRNTLNTGLPNAMVSTFNYTPQVGMRDQTDPNGVTSYEYDPAGRLKNTRDKDQNILSRNYYHYYSSSGTDVASLSLTPATMSFPYTASSSPFTITSNCSWTITSNQTWLTANPPSGSFNGSVTLSATVNPGAQRVGVATVTYGTGQTKTVTVTQAVNGSTLSATPTSILMGKQSVWYYVTVTSNTSWTATTDRPSWITVSPTSGTGNGTIGIKPTALSSGTRMGSVTIATTDGARSVIINITQNSSIN